MHLFVVIGRKRHRCSVSKLPKPTNTPSSGRSSIVGGVLLCTRLAFASISSEPPGSIERGGISRPGGSEAPSTPPSIDADKGSSKAAHAWSHKRLRFVVAAMATSWVSTLLRSGWVARTRRLRTALMRRSCSSTARSPSNSKRCFQSCADATRPRRSCTDSSRARLVDGSASRVSGAERLRDADI